MTKARSRYAFEPATMTWQETAEYAFRRGESWLRSEIEALCGKGFPRPHKTLCLFLKADVDRWLEREYGHSTTLDDQTKTLIERAKRGANQGAVPRRQDA